MDCHDRGNAERECLHWVDVSGRHFGGDRECISEENDRFHDHL
jgi:hypothetical protein